MPDQDSSKKACYNCVKRRIICDKTGTHCNKCAKKNLTCPGYGIRYRFAKGAASSSLPPASSLEVEHARTERQRKNYKWVEYSRQPTTTGPRTSRTSLVVSNSSPTPLHAYSRPIIPATLSDLDPRTRSYLMHFVVHVSPFTVVFDDEVNGYRHHVLPMAYSDPSVQRAVCVASAFHLAAKEPRLRAPAEIIRAGLIRKLSQASITNPDLSEATWTTLILLIIADMVTGHEDVSALIDLLATFLDARGPLKEPATELEKFLHFQSCIISFFTRPFSSLEPRPIRPPEMSNDPVSVFKHYTNSLRNYQRRGDSPLYKTNHYAACFPIFEEVYHLASEIYTMRMESTDSSDNIEHDVEDRLQRIRSLCEKLGPTAPGGHAIAWPIFVAAAESSSADDRAYFATMLRRIWERTGYANLSRGLEVLPKLWAQRGRRSWTSAMEDYRGLVIC
ncbi:fungal-specific transcription factor domain-containing protein [Hypoxylon sp. FL1857]|nr:fungal-specific transcription factor domain-containing protein [Hypoxylon sp. FL1857]